MTEWLKWTELLIKCMAWERQNRRKIMVWFSTAFLFLPQHLPTGWGYGIQIEETRLQFAKLHTSDGTRSLHGFGLVLFCFSGLYQCRKECVFVWATPQLLPTILSFNKVSLIESDYVSHWSYVSTSLSCWGMTSLELVATWTALFSSSSFYDLLAH